MKCRYKPLVIMLLALLGVPLATLLAHHSGYRINISSSMPIGLYKETASTDIKKGDIIEACLPSTVAAEGLASGYLFHGSCPSGAASVVKLVIAVPGDQVLVLPFAMLVNGERFFAPVRQFDRAKRVINRHTASMRHLSKGYWLYGVNNPIYSWDSRYFGEVSAASIRGVYQSMRTI
jgi:conjugative transfer signal peptidase TraF